MTPNVFCISDTHFGHRNLLNPEVISHGRAQDFSSVEEMDETMIERWNAVVRDQDKVYHLGDVSFWKEPRFGALISRLKGRKTLLLGNHDLLESKIYARYFKYVRGVREIDGMLMSHVPVHPGQRRRFRANIHGHTHRALVDPLGGFPYINVCVEVTGYAPVALEDIQKRVKL